MKRLIIICEGETEVEFCRKILYPYFLEKQITVLSRNITGIKKWRSLKRLIEHTLKSEKSAFLTTLIDYYGLPSDYPNFRTNDVAEIENGMKEEIDNHRFIPYIQLHEFEGLIFNNIAVFYNVFSEKDLVGKDELTSIFQEFPNPEMINNSVENAPSKRLKRIIPRYDKVVSGNNLAEKIGLQNIRNKCPRFNAWIEKIEKI